MDIFNKIGEIANAWLISLNPSEDKQKLANDRYEICKSCPSLKTAMAGTPLKYLQCGKCGCPIHKKIFSPNWNACPLEKWMSVENEYFNVKEKSKTKTIL